MSKHSFLLMIEILALAVLGVALIVTIFPEIDASIAWTIAYCIIGVGVLAAILLGLLTYMRYMTTIYSKMDALQGACWELIKMMENSGPGGAESRATRAETTVERFGVIGATSVLATRPLATWQEINPELTDAGLKLADIYRGDSRGFRASRGAIRNGLAIFLAILRDSNLQSAYTLLVEHMKAQRDEFEDSKKKTLPNYANLKQFLDLPIDWPTGDIPERCHGQTLFGYKTSMRALYGIGSRLFAGLEYQSPAIGDRQAVLFAEAQIPVAMREFIRTDDTGQAIKRISS